MIYIVLKALNLYTYFCTLSVSRFFLRHPPYTFNYFYIDHRITN